MLNGFICVFVKVDQNKIDNIIADKDLHCRITMKNISIKLAIKKQFMRNSQKTQNNQSTWGTPILHL